MAYRFKLETALTVRRNLEELAQQKLAREQLALEAQAQKLAGLRQERLALIEEFENKKRTPMAAPLFSFYMEGIALKEEETRAAALALEQCRQALEQARAELAERMRDRQVLEKARERDRQKFILAQLKKEQNEADEQVVLRFGRKESL